MDRKVVLTGMESESNGLWVLWIGVVKAWRWPLRKSMYTLTLSLRSEQMVSWLLFWLISSNLHQIIPMFAIHVFPWAIVKKEMEYYMLERERLCFWLLVISSWTDVNLLFQLFFGVVRENQISVTYNNSRLPNQINPFLECRCCFMLQISYTLWRTRWLEEELDLLNISTLMNCPLETDCNSFYSYHGSKIMDSSLE